MVLVVLGLTAAFATMGFQRLESDRLTRQAGELSSWLQNLSDSAVLDGAVYGAWLSADGERLESAYYYNHRWWQVDGDALASEKLADGVSLSLRAGDDKRRWQPLVPATSVAGEREPAVIFLPTGIAIPDTFRLEDGERRIATVARDENGLYTWSLEP